MSFATINDLYPDLFKIDNNREEYEEENYIEESKENKNKEDYMGIAGYELFPFGDDSSIDKKIEYSENERLRKENNKLKEELEEYRKKEYLKLDDYEHIVISAVRYSLGKIDYIVKTTVNYVLQEIEYDKLSDNCLDIIRNEIENYLKNQKNLKDYEEMWKKLLNRIEEVI